MKKIGIIGGFSCESTADYYLRITRKANFYLKNLQTVDIIMISVNPDDIVKAMHENQWQSTANMIIDTAKQLEKMGADCILIPCNTLHKIANEVQQSISIPLLNIMHCVGDHLKEKKLSKVALLGTTFTMEDAFYREHLGQHYQIETITPTAKDRHRLHHIIFDELCHGKIKLPSKIFLTDLCHRMYEKNNCQAVILGCSELPLMIKPDDVYIPLIDTVDIHSEYAVQFALEKIITAKKVA